MRRSLAVILTLIWITGFAGPALASGYERKGSGYESGEEVKGSPAREEMKGSPHPRMEDMTEEDLREYLKSEGYSEEMIETQIEVWRSGEMEEMKGSGY